MTSSPRAHLPPRLLPILYFGAAHVAVALAFGAVAVDPRGVSGFFYNARMLGIVHLITLGWITASILGSLYIVGPIALRMWIPATWLDYTAFALVLIGIVGMEGRLLPIFAWYWAYANTGYKGPVPSQHEMPCRSGQELVFVLWLFGVPALAGGLAFDAISFASAAAWCLLAATLIDAANAARILRYAFLRPSSAPL